MPMEVFAHHTEDVGELRRRVRREKNAKQRDRYRAVLLALEGRPASEIVEKLSRSRNFVQRWVYAYRDGGLSAIRITPQPGRPTKLPRRHEQALLDRLRQDGRILRGRDIMAILEREFGVCYSLPGAYDLLHRLGYEPLKPRPVNPKKDADDEAVWKQAAPLLSRSSGRSPRSRT